MRYVRIMQIKFTASCKNNVFSDLCKKLQSIKGKLIHKLKGTIKKRTSKHRRTSNSDILHGIIGIRHFSYIPEFDGLVFSV
jgi:hypothetical protein